MMISRRDRQLDDPFVSETENKGLDGFRSPSAVNQQSTGYTQSSTPPVRFYCKKCLESFTFSSNLSRHEKEQHKEGREKPFPCRFCQKPFTRKSYQSRHEKESKCRKKWMLSCNGGIQFLSLFSEKYQFQFLVDFSWFGPQISTFIACHEWAWITWDDLGFNFNILQHEARMYVNSNLVLRISNFPDQMKPPFEILKRPVGQRISLAIYGEISPCKPLTMFLGS